MATFTDPGSTQHLLKKLKKNANEMKAMNNKKYKFCDKCDLIKPERAHHCTICNKCILKMDHHCPWVNNCVGHLNQRYFLLFIFYLLVALILLTLFYGVIAYHKDFK